MNCKECGQHAPLHITLARDYAACEELHFCETHAHEFLCGNSSAMQESTPPWVKTGADPVVVNEEARIDLEKVIICENQDQQVLVFRMNEGGFTFPLICGVFEATSIDRRLKTLGSPRPLTHDALAATITAMGGKLRDVIIDSLREHTYYAKLRILREESPAVSRLVEVDVRPSDAVALAVTCKVPIFVDRMVLAEAWEG